jgi:hypothetical protein
VATAGCVVVAPQVFVIHDGTQGPQSLRKPSDVFTMHFQKTV